VFHSIVGGATLEWFGLFKQHSDIKHILAFKSPLNLQDEESIYQGMLAEYSGQGYDRWAFCFWAYRAFMWRVFGTPLPEKNDWAKAGFNLCTGLAGGIKWIKRWADENHIDLEMIEPHDLYVKLLATGYFVEVKQQSDDESSWK
jgi:hypothetical protein